MLFEGREIRTAIELAFDHLDAVHLPFDDPLAPCRFHCCSNGGVIPANPHPKSDQLRQLRLFCTLSPRIQCGSLMAAYECHKGTDMVLHHHHIWTALGIGCQ